jgi:hypothetical protein
MTTPEDELAPFTIDRIMIDFLRTGPPGGEAYVFTAEAEEGLAAGLDAIFAYPGPAEAALDSLLRLSIALEDEGAVSAALLIRAAMSADARVGRVFQPRNRTPPHMDMKRLSGESDSTRAPALDQKAPSDAVSVRDLLSPFDRDRRRANGPNEL